MRCLRVPAVIIAAAILSCSVAKAGILIGALSPVVTAQTNTPTFQTNSAYIPLGQFTISNNGLIITNAYTGAFRYSFDGATWFTNGSPIFTPAVTNAGSAVIQPQTLSVPVYVQMVAITNAANTSAIQLGVTSP